MKVSRFIMAMMFSIVLAVNAYGAVLTYSPSNASVTVPPGGKGEVSLTVGLEEGGHSTYYLWFIDSEEGNIPLEWLDPDEDNSFLSMWWNSASTKLIITVPEDAEPGVYSGYVYSRAIWSHSIADEGDGIYIEVTVSSSCSEKPEFNIAPEEPVVLWPPNKSLTRVAVEGTVDMPEGCTLFEMGYSLDDEYGIYTGMGTIKVDSGGKFFAYIPVEAWRDGRDKDGRHYTITLYGENEAGIGTSNVIKVVVPHDKRR